MSQPRRGTPAMLILPMLLPALNPQPLFACAACYGQSNSAMAQGMNWGICSLLVIIVAVLGGVASFFVYLARRSAALPEAMPAEPSPNQTSSATAHVFN